MNFKNTIMENKREQKTVYDLELHEVTVVQITGDGIPIKWQVTRVPGGWFYQDINPNRTTVSEFFVAFNNEFQKRRKPTHTIFY